jgi:hypothetical protein
MNTMKFKFPLLFTLLLGLFLFACQDETSLDIIDEEQEVDLDVSDDESYYLTAAGREDETAEHPTAYRYRKLCVRPVFPLNLVFPNDSTLEVNSLRELRQALLRWKRSGNDGRPMIAFPHEVILPDSSIVTVESREEVRELLLQCLKDRRPNLDSCYQIIYPIDVELGDGNVVSIDSKEAFKDLIKDWAQNKDSLPRPQIVFPIELMLNDGTVDTLESPGELKELTKDCLPRNRPCFKWKFPLSLELPDGSTVSVNTKVEMIDFMKEYRENNTGNISPKITFPQDVTLKNGKNLTIDNLLELKRLRRLCSKQNRRG